MAYQRIPKKKNQITKKKEKKTNFPEISSATEDILWFDIPMNNLFLM
jgi:hypothetical protein